MKRSRGCVENTELNGRPRPHNRASQTRDQTGLPEIGFAFGIPYLGFSSDFWASLRDDYKLKGTVSDVLTYEDIQTILIIRCNMSVPAGDYLERRLRSSIAAELQFSVRPLPDRNPEDVGGPLLTAVFETKKADLGLLTIYPTITIPRSGWARTRVSGRARAARDSETRLESSGAKGSSSRSDDRHDATRRRVAGHPGSTHSGATASKTSAVPGNGPSGRTA